MDKGDRLNTKDTNNHLSNPYQSTFLQELNCFFFSILMEELILLLKLSRRQRREKGNFWRGLFRRVANLRGNVVGMGS